MHKLAIIRPVMYVKVDGGISSQMHFYLVGEKLRRLSKADIQYDLDWFNYDALDMDGKYSRNFDLLKLFPNLYFPIAKNNWKLRLYRLLYTHEHDASLPQNSWESLRPPLFLSGYYAADDEFYSEMAEIFISEPIGLSETDKMNATEIESSENSVGMHVRRGDLARFLPAYGSPAPTKYFAHAVKLLQTKYGEDIRIFIFSDEPDWVTANLLPELPKGNYRLMENNKSDKGYVDLWLLSRCKHFISSSGSFGKFAAMMNPRHGDVIIYSTPESEIWQRRIERVTLLSDKDWE